MDSNTQRAAGNSAGGSRPQRRIISIDDDDLVDYEYEQPNIFLQAPRQEEP